MDDTDAEVQAEVRELEKRARAGEPRAQYVVSAILGRLGRKEEARAWLAKATEAGEVDAIYTTACRHLDGVDGPRDIARAVAMLQDAVSRGGAAAMRTLAVLQAMGEGLPRDWPGAISLLHAASNAGDGPAHAQLCVLLGLPDNIRATVVDDVLRQGALGQEPDPMLPARVELSQRPHTARMDALLTPLECRYLMEAAVPLLHPVFVVDQPTGRLVKSTQRTGRIASIHPLQQDMVMLLINRRLSAAAGIPVENGEMLTFIAYAQGEEYRPHHDWLEPSEGNVGQRQSAGQREATVMVCLNDGYEGGETHFESSGQRFRGQPGDALVLRNLDPSGQPDRTTRHAGLPVTAGIKWMLSKYYRQRAYVC